MPDLRPQIHHESSSCTQTYTVDSRLLTLWRAQGPGLSMWVGERGIQRWIGGEFPEPEDDELKLYRVSARNKPDVCGSKKGTPAGAKRHYRARETPCEPCRKANVKDKRKSRDRDQGKQCPDCGKTIGRRSTRCVICTSKHRWREEGAA